MMLCAHHAWVFKLILLQCVEPTSKGSKVIQEPGSCPGLTLIFSPPIATVHHLDSSGSSLSQLPPATVASVRFLRVEVPSIPRDAETSMAELPISPQASRKQGYRTPSVCETE